MPLDELRNAYSPSTFVTCMFHREEIFGDIVGKICARQVLRLQRLRLRLALLPVSHRVRQQIANQRCLVQHGLLYRLCVEQ